MKRRTRISTPYPKLETVRQEMRVSKRRFRFLQALVLSLIPSTAIAAIPWNSTVNTITPAGGAGTCSLPSVCIFNLTGDLTSLTLSGGTAGQNYSLIFVQDSNGAHAFTPPTNLVGGSFIPVLPSIPSAANAWTSWVVRFDGAKYVLQAAYDNFPIFDVYANTYQSLGTSVVNGTLQRQVRAPATISVIFPGMTPTSTCWCVPQINPSLSPHNLPAQWQKGVFAVCMPDTNSATCGIVNPTGTPIIPDQDALNIRGLP